MVPLIGRVTGNWVEFVQGEVAIVLFVADDELSGTLALMNLLEALATVEFRNGAVVLFAIVLLPSDVLVANFVTDGAVASSTPD
jgi:hypothetical protein